MPAQKNTEVFQNRSSFGLLADSLIESCLLVFENMWASKASAFHYSDGATLRKQGS